MILVLHNYVHVLASCDRVNLIQDGVIAFDKPTAETSIEELTELVVSEYRRARMRRHERTWSASTSGRCRRARSSSTRATGRARDGRVRVPARRDGSRPDGAASPQWALQDPADYVEALRVRPCRRGRGGRHRPRSGSSASPPTSPPARRCRRWPTARRLRPPDACAYVSCGSTTRRSATPTASTPSPRARRAVAGALRRAHLLRVGGREGAAAARGGAGAVRAHGPLDRGRGLDRLAAVRARDAQRLRWPATRPSTRTAPIPAAAFLGALDDRFGGPREPTSSTARSCRSARAPARSPRRRRRGRACDPGSRWPSATSTRTSPRPRPAPSIPASC